MSTTDPKPTVSRSFDVANEIGELHGLLEAVNSRCDTLDSLLEQNSETLALLTDTPKTVTMSCKNKITFSGKSQERVEDFISHMSNLALANGWTDLQTAGQTVVALTGESQSWYLNILDHTKVETEGKLDFGKLCTELKARFTSAFSPTDLLSEVLAIKQDIGESVDDYLARIVPKVALLDLSEEMKAGLVVRNFTSGIRMELELRDLKKVADVEHLAVKLERLFMTHKWTGPKPEVAAMEADTESEVVAAAAYQPADTMRGSRMTKQAPRSNYRGAYRGSNRGGFRAQKDNSHLPCWSCGMLGHFQRECPLNRNVGFYPGQSVGGQSVGSMYSVPTFNMQPSWQFAPPVSYRPPRPFLSTQRRPRGSRRGMRGNVRYTTSQMPAMQQQPYYPTLN